MIYRSSVNHSLKESLQDVYSFRLFCEKKNEEIDYYLSDDMMMEAENSEKKESVFAKIGQAIIDILNKFTEVMTGFLNRFRDSSLKNKSNIVKAEKMMKRHPEFKDEIMQAIKDGKLELTDIKSLKELDSVAEELTKLALKKSIDPKSLRGRWEKAKEAFKKGINKDGTILTTVAAAASVVSLGIGITTLKKNIDDIRDSANNANNYAKESIRQLKEIEKGLKDKNSTPEEQKEYIELFSGIRRIFSEWTTIHVNVSSKDSASINKLIEKITSVIEKSESKNN